MRVSSVTAAGYERDTTTDDDRFRDFAGAIQSMVTSSAQNDSGVFEVNLRDERYLPFEVAGAIGTWQIELPNDVPQFDFETISDLVFHLRYTARSKNKLTFAPATIPFTGDATAGWTINIDRTSPIFAFLKKCRAAKV